ncbi:MFS transporter [Caballeronia zhejiangensis]|uniref:MFS transporter n=1 Tax=Caballeronia zhejiangensis TaxID=871203 RepID=UPI001EF5548F|nr:MFS transporter [Caballeronia zhejiangensis]MCG7400377.1 MFS transporter [Caballeronia zhejiangensis]
MSDTSQTTVPESTADACRQSRTLVRDSARSWYVLGVLTLSYALAYIDRQLLNLLVDPIRRTLVISDTELSLIQGMAFVSAYLMAAPLFGRLVDITNRRNILVAGICLWCACTALCGWADTYVGLFAARFGVGASEACVFPVCCSLISEHFSPRAAPRALSIFTAGQWIGAGFSLVAGGFVVSLADSVRPAFPMFNALATWQIAFVLVGLPGLLLAAVLLLSVHEPVRRTTPAAYSDDRPFSLRESASFIWERRGFYGRVYIGVGMLAIVTLAMPAWLPSYLMRSHGVSPALVGYRLGLLAVILGTTGVLLGPWVARIFERKGHRDAALRTAGFSMVGMFFFCVALPFAPSARGVFIAAAGAIFCFSLPIGIIAAATQLSTPSRLRGVVASLHTFLAQSIGFGIGPTAIALITDKVFGDPRMVGYSLGIVSSIASAIAAWLIFTALPHYRRMLDERHIDLK